MSTGRPLPRSDPDSAAFWDGCRRHMLLAQQCDSCRVWRWPPKEFCPRCHSREATWQTLNGAGKVVAFVVMHRVFDPVFADELPLVLAHVSLDGTDDEVVMVTNVVGCDWQEVSVGLAVEVTFEERAEGCVLPVFRPRAR